MNQLYFYQKLKICHPHHEKISLSLDTFHFYTTRFSPRRAMDFFLYKKKNKYTIYIPSRRENLVVSWYVSFEQKLKICHPHHEKITWSLDTFHFDTTRFSPGRAMNFFHKQEINIKFTYPQDKKISWSLDTFHLNITKFLILGVRFFFLLKNQMSIKIYIPTPQENLVVLW